MSDNSSNDGSDNREEDSVNIDPNNVVRTNLQNALAKGIRVVPVKIENQMKEAYLDYAMSVIVGRALPDVRDGLKPVHRRILYAMNERAWRHDRPFVKCAKIVGEVIGNFHPHGDVAIYDTLVRMAQDFSLREVLIDGQGNFGSIDGDSPAAYRYTEARLTRMAEELLRDIDKETVDYSPNFDDTRKEPRVLPASFPNLLVNGSTGIAVGMATNIPPHNLNEVITAAIEFIKNPEISIEELMKIVKMPDFPTGGIIIDKDNGLRSAYTKGRGSFYIRAVSDIETNKRGRDVIVITEIPYQVNKKNLLEKIGQLASTKVIEGINDIRDLSDRHGIRVEIELKKDTNAQVILNQLYKQTQLQISYGMNVLALVNNEPRILSLKDILREYVSHRKEVVIRRTKFDLDRAEKREHILQGLKIALDFIDEVIKIIRSSSNVEIARNSLMARFTLSEIQANAILDMRLQKLTSLESQKIIDELKELEIKIINFKSILSSESIQYNIISTELTEINGKYVSKRKTVLEKLGSASITFEATDLIAEEDVVILITENDFIKRMPLDTFRRQRRGGRGVKGGAKKEDVVKIMRLGSTHDNLLLFSNRGKVFGIKVHELPLASRESRGKSLKAIITLSGDETITAMSSFADFNERQALVMVSKKGILKKCDLNNFSSLKKGGLIAINLRNDDELINVSLVEPKDDILLASRNGNALRTNLAKMRSQGRTAAGIIGMRLEENDVIIGMDVVKDDTSLLVVSEKGYGKRVDYSSFSVKGRGGKGMTYLKISDKSGCAMSVSSVHDDDDVIIVAQSGMTIRLRASEINKIGRGTIGIRLLNLKENDAVSDVAIISENK